MVRESQPDTRPLIFEDTPATWQELEARVAQILRECNYDVEAPKRVQLARGDVNVDVWADEHRSPPNIIVIECKNWSEAVTKTIVHAFRTVVGDSGATLGLIVSSAGFQDGAIEAAAYSNVRLLDWAGLQYMFASRWVTDFMKPTIYRETDPLYEYTEPLNSRIFRKADGLPEGRQEAFRELRGRYGALAMLCMAVGPGPWARMSGSETTVSELPLRTRLGDYRLLLPVDHPALPSDILDATALRPLMEAVIRHASAAIAEFDELFGGRA